MGDHVFISYDREDLDYVTGLTKALSEEGIESWSDTKMRTAAQWVEKIQEQLDSSAAFVVVMSPAAAKSSWVGREIDQAELKQRPIFPLLLGGERFFRLGHLLWEDVEGGRLPSEEWFSEIGRLVGTGTDETALDQEQREDEARRMAEEQARLAEAKRLADEQARREAEAKRLAEQQEAEEQARREAEEARRRAEEEEERRRRRMRAILIGIAAAVVVVGVIVIIVALSGGGGDGGGDGTQTAEVTVPGDQAFTDTGVQCEAGGTLAITADGAVFHNEETSTGPDGDPGVPPEFNVVSGAPHAALIGRLDDGDPFLVGSSFTGTCQLDGALSLGINDSGTANNSGEFSATVEVQPAG